MNTLVSVVIPSYNSEKTVVTAVKSAITQMDNIEIIIIDDASTDNTYDFIKPLLSDRRIIYVKNEKNSGVAYCRNRGVEMAKGKYIAFLDSDDIWRKGKLEKQIQLIEKTGACLCGCARELIDEKGESTDKIIKVPDKIGYKGLLNGNIINCSSVLVPAEIMKKYPMTDDDIHEDYITWLRILKDHGDAVFLKSPYLLYRVSSTSKSGNKMKSAIKTYKVYRRIGLNVFSSFYHFVRYAFAAVNKYYM